MPVAILGLETTNCFIDSSGNWLSQCYIPAYIRKYPFVFFKIPNKHDYALCIDEAAPNYVAEAGKSDHRLFDDHEEPTQVTQAALDFNAKYLEYSNLTESVTACLSGYKLLTPGQSEAILPNGKKSRLSGFQIFETTTFNELRENETAVLDLHHKQAFAYIYYVLQSQSNWQNLLNLSG